jgi:hypothetical protein
MDENKSIRFEMRLDPSLVSEIDKWSEGMQMSRSEAARSLISRGLGMEISKGEKLILSSLGGIAQELKLKNSTTDLGLITNALSRGHTWAIDWEYDWLGCDETRYQFVKETVDILSMWNDLAHVYKNLSKEDKQKVNTASKFVKWDKFPGFDGNYEPHYGIALFLIEKMKRFTNFDPQNINSHCPMVSRYLEAYSEFHKLRYQEHKDIGIKELLAITARYDK